MAGNTAPVARTVAPSGRCRPRPGQKREWSSIRVSGWQGLPSPSRIQPLKSICQSRLGAAFSKRRVAGGPPPGQRIGPCRHRIAWTADTAGTPRLAPPRPRAILRAPQAGWHPAPPPCALDRRPTGAGSRAAGASGPPGPPPRPSATASCSPSSDGSRTAGTVRAGWPPPARARCNELPTRIHHRHLLPRHGQPPKDPPPISNVSAMSPNTRRPCLRAQQQAR